MTPQTAHCTRQGVPQTEHRRDRRGTFVEIRIGIQHAPRELAFETSQPVEEIERLVAEGLEQGSLVKLSDDKGRRYLISASQLAFIELGEEHRRTVGFVA